MNIAVLLKSVVATDEPIIVRDDMIEDAGVKKVINPYDEYGLEEALRMKEAFGGTVTVISAGPEKTVEALRTALAMGADEAVWIHLEEEDAYGKAAGGGSLVADGKEAVVGGSLVDRAVMADGKAAADEHTYAFLLAAAITRGGYEPVFAGHMSVDNGAGQVAIRLAELLGWPHAGAVIACRVVEIGTASGSESSEGDGRALQVTRDAEGDSESWELPLPALLTAQQGLNEPRYPALAGIMKAKRKPLTELTPSQLRVELASVEAAPRTVRLGCDAPPVRQTGRMLGGVAKEQAAELLGLLRNEAQVLKER